MFYFIDGENVAEKQILADHRVDINKSLVMAYKTELFGMTESVRQYDRMKVSIWVVKDKDIYEEIQNTEEELSEGWLTKHKGVRRFVYDVEQKNGEVTAKEHAVQHRPPKTTQKKKNGGKSSGRNNQQQVRRSTSGGNRT